MEKILDKARELAASILDSQIFKELRQEEGRILAKAEARALLERYEQALVAMRRKEMEMQPISVEEKRSLEELEQAITKDEDLVLLMRAQGAYRELMDRVNRTIQENLSAALEGQEPPEKPEADAPQGRIILP